MLKKLYIKNFALIDEITVHFDQGLNIITGETGAGKSIIINAINLLLGERTSIDVIRDGFESAFVEGEFIIPQILRSIDIWNEIDVDDTNILIIRREIHLRGRSRSFINDSPISNAVLKQIGEYLVDLHGQHEHQALFNTNYHLTCLDNYGVEPDLLDQVSSTYKLFKSTQNAQKQLIEKSKLINEKKDLIEFQVQEIEKINPEIGEDHQLEQEEKILQNSEKLLQTTQILNQLLYEGELSVYEKLTESIQQLTSLSQIDKQFNEYTKSCESARIITEEIAKGCQNYIDNIEFDSERLETIRDRLVHINRLKKKYGTDLNQVLNFYDSIKQELNNIENIDQQIKNAENEYKNACNLLSNLCQKLTMIRQKLAIELEIDIKHLLSDLGMINNQFNIEITRKEDEKSPICIDTQCFRVTAKGWDNVEFLISLNLGESLKKLKDVASGGEISRIMLALKTKLAEADAIPVLIFDEIDSGISGRIARIVGQKLKELAQQHQVICITHLPQIASLSDQHLVVQKTVQEERSTTTMRLLNDEERIQEIAKLLGGETITETTLESAKELIQADL